jgi:VWFA-related protein
MTNLSRSSCISLVGVLMLSLSGSAQFRETVEVRLHNIDVIVETRAGEPVTNLTKEDFIVKQDGVVQTITNFSTSSQVTRQSPEARTVGTAAVREARRFVFFLDEAGLNDLARNDLMHQASSLISQMNGDDEVMIVAAAATKQIPLFFTSDKKRAMATMDAVTGQMMRLYDQERFGNQTKATTAMTMEVGEDTQTDFVYRRGECSGINCSEQRLKMLRQVLESLAQVPGRKIMFLLTNRITSVPDWTMQKSRDPGAGPTAAMAALRREAILDHGKNLQPVVEEVARIAADSNVTVYGIEPYEAGEVALSGVSAERSGQIAPQAAATRGLPGAFDVLMDLAKLTGGRAFSGGSKDFGRMFQQASRDLDVSYSLAIPDKAGRKPGHNIEVSIKDRPELIVRARRHVTSRPEEVEFQQRAVGALLTASPENPLGISMKLSPLVRQGNFIDVPITVNVPLNKLTITRQGDSYRGSFGVYVAVAAGDKVDFRNAHQKNTQEIVIPAADWEAVKDQAFQYGSTVRVKPGRYRVSVGVTDALSGESGFNTFDVVAR